MGYPGRAGNIQNELGSEVAVKRISLMRDINWTN